MKMDKAARRGLSTIIAIVLFIVITVGLAAFVWAYMSGWLPSMLSATKSIDVEAMGVADITGTKATLTVTVRNTQSLAIVNLTISIIKSGQEIATFTLAPLNSAIGDGQSRTFKISVDASNNKATLSDTLSGQTATATISSNIAPGDKITVLVIATFQDGSTASAQTQFIATRS